MAAIVGAALTVVAAPVASAASPALAVFSGSSFGIGDPSTSVRIADVTDDGLNDLIASSPGVPTIAVFAQQPDHTLSAAVSLSTDGTAPTLLLATGDLNDDGIDRSRGRHRRRRRRVAAGVGLARSEDPRVDRDPRARRRDR